MAKTFTGKGENPALMFINTQEAETAPETDPAIPPRAETKSKRVQLLMKPSTVAKLRARATAEGRSFNDLVNTILEENV